MAALAAGSRIGQHEVISAIGAGKILPDSFAADPRRPLDLPGRDQTAANNSYSTHAIGRSRPSAFRRPAPEKRAH